MNRLQITDRKTLIVTACFIYVIYHLLTLAYSPLPWFDEVAFASITDSYLKNGTFVEDARRVSWQGEKLMYGPIYFVWQAALVKVFGMSMFSFRITGLLFGLVNLYLVFRICKVLGFSALATLLTVALVALDPSYNQFLHSGRMDMITLFFFLVSYLAFRRAAADSRGYILYAMLAGLLMACGMLTNPRICFTLPFFGCFFVYELLQHSEARLKVLIKYVVFGVTLVAIYSVWIYGKFGSLSNFIAVNYTNSKVMKDHVGFTLKELKLNQSLLVFSYCVFCVVLLAGKRRLKENAHLLLLTVPVIAGFLLVVSGGLAGRYYASVAPFTTMLFVGATVTAGRTLYSKIAWGAAGLFAVVFIAKAITLLGELRLRDAGYFEKRITAVVPPHVSVAADFPYYYMLRNNLDTFQALEENGEFPVKVAHFKRVTFDYIVVNGNKEVLRKYYEERFLNGRYDLVAEVKRDVPKGLIQRIAGMLPYMIDNTYACYIYKLKQGVTRVPY